MTCGNIALLKKYTHKKKTKQKKKKNKPKKKHAETILQSSVRPLVRPLSCLLVFLYIRMNSQEKRKKTKIKRKNKKKKNIVQQQNCNLRACSTWFADSFGCSVAEPFVTGSCSKWFFFQPNIKLRYQTQSGADVWCTRRVSPLRKTTASVKIDISIIRTE